MYWSVKDLSSFFCLLYNSVPVGYDRLLFYERNIGHHLLSVLQA
jgi:hypothetical protein